MYLRQYFDFLPFFQILNKRNPSNAPIVFKNKSSISVHRLFSNWLTSIKNEKQNPTTFTLIHYQGFNRADYLELSSQLHLCSFYDRIAVGLFMCSTKISQVFLDGIFWYWSEVKSNHMGGVTMGASYYENLFNEACGDYNLPYENVFLSRFSLLENTHYVEHNAKLTDEEISAIKVLFEEFSKSYKKSQEQINDLLKSLNINEL